MKILGIFFYLILISLAIFIIRNLLNKNIILEGWVLNLKSDLVNLLDTTRELDEKQLFEKDDEVGVLWQSIISLINKLEYYLNNIGE